MFWREYVGGSATSQNPKLLILDEPLNALDSEAVEKVHKILRRFKAQNATIIITCHDKEELELLSDEIIPIENGEIKYESR